MIDRGFSTNWVCLLNVTGLIIADNPNINSKLQILLPIIFPTDMSEYPSKADVVLTNSSGIDVPIETIVNPIIISDICNFFAIWLEPSTNISAPFINSKKPITINTICNIIYFTHLNILGFFNFMSAKFKE